MWKVGRAPAGSQCSEPDFQLALGSQPLATPAPDLILLKSMQPRTESKFLFAWSVFKNKVVGATKKSYFEISCFSTKSFNKRINSVLKVLCVFSRCELFRLLWYESLYTRPNRNIFRICMTAFVCPCCFKESCVISVVWLICAVGYI